MSSSISAPMPTGVANSEHVKVLLPVGAGYDIISGSYYYDSSGKAWLNGGASKYWAIGGEPNSYKSAQVRHVSNTMADRLGQCGVQVPNLTYDSENTADHSHNRNSLSHMPYLSKNDPLVSGYWQITSKQEMWGCEFYEHYKSWVKELEVNFNRSKNKMLSTVFMDSQLKGEYKVRPPIQLVVDSVSELESKATGEQGQKAKLGGKDGKMVYVYAGLDKSRFLSSVSTLGSHVNAYVFLTSHMGEDNQVQSSFSGNMPPKKKLTDMPAGIKFKGVPKNFYYLLINIWMTKTARVVSNKANYKVEEYPQVSSDEAAGDTQSVHTSLVRSKSSTSGGSINIICSQTYGVIPELTEYHNCKAHGLYSLGGSPVSHHSVFYPDVSMSRITCRSKMKADKVLRRAILLGSEMLQIFTYKKYKYPETPCTPEELYQDLIDIGYDWSKILASRSWHSLNNENHPVKSLSTMDILNFRIGRYHEKEYLKDTVKEPNKEVIDKILKRDGGLKK